MLQACRARTGGSCCPCSTLITADDAEQCAQVSRVVSEVTVMISLSLLLRPRYRDTLASRIGWRAEVCPPSLRQAPRSGWNRLWFWLLAPGPLQSAPALNRLPPVRQDFLQSVVDISGDAASAL